MTNHGTRSSAANLKRVKRIFLDALKEPLDCRLKFVQDVAGSDKQLRDEVFELLNAAGKTDVGIENIVSSAAYEISHNHSVLPGDGCQIAVCGSCQCFACVGKVSSSEPPTV